MSEQNQAKEEKLDQSRNVVAVFVVQFDVHKGNVIEWQYPADMDLEGIEYQAICSGLHNVNSDVLYFTRKDSYYGISMFKNMSTNTSRGAYMKAIGLLVKPTKDTGVCGEVWKHKDYLAKEISQHMAENIEPGRYENLIQYFDQHKFHDYQVESARTSWLHDKSLLYASEHSVNYNLTHNMDTSIVKSSDLIKPNDFLDLLELLRDDIFVLWKASILRKRIMFIDDPRLGNSCGYVHCTHLMGHIPDKFTTVQPIIPKFTVGVNDISDFEKNKAGSFVACTPDSIFQIKSNLYDTTITFSSSPYKPKIPKTGEAPLLESHERNFQIKSSAAPVQSAANAADTKRYYILLKLLQNQLSEAGLHPIVAKPRSLSLVTDFYYWLYKEETGEEPWKDTFDRKQSYQSSRSSSRRESGGLGVFQERYSDEEDAMEINPNDIPEVVAARASGEMTRINSDYLRQKYQLVNNTLINFFQNLTYYLLLTLQDIISENEEDDVITIYPKDMIELGLDPLKDADFVVELAQVYFDKVVKVHGLPSMQICFSTCCLQKRDESYIRI